MSESPNTSIEWREFHRGEIRVIRCRLARGNQAQIYRLDPVALLHTANTVSLQAVGRRVLTGGFR